MRSDDARAYNRRVAVTAPPRTWILTGSPENFAVTRELGLGLVGLKERHRRLALEIEMRSASAIPA
jgi:hypothetical protein